MKPLLQIFLLFLSAVSHAVPYISSEAALDVLKRDYAGETLYWKPTDLPLTIEQMDRSPEANQLDTMYELGLVDREREIATADIGNGHRKVVLSWRYFWPERTSANEPEGVPYGKRRVHSIITMTDPIERDAIWYVEIHLRWYAAQLADWVDNKSLVRARPLRRALESYEKPFEATVYLEYHNHHWRLWHPG